MRSAWAVPTIDPLSRSAPTPSIAPGAILVAAFGCLLASQAMSHAISNENAAFVEALQGPAPAAFGYLGGKHMVTGVDHLLFLVGVVFYLRRLRDVIVLASLFTLGHSLTLMIGVLADVGANAALVDAVIGLSVVYKGFENLGGFGTHTPPATLVVFGFGLVHGLGLATKVRDLSLSDDGLIVNLLSFNVGVEVGQILALSLIVGVLFWLSPDARQSRPATAMNVLLMVAGWILVILHLSDFMQS